MGAKEKEIISAKCKLICYLISVCYVLGANIAIAKHYVPRYHIAFSCCYVVSAKSYV